MNSPEELIKQLLAGVATSTVQKEVAASVRLDRLLCTILADGYIPPPSIIVLRSSSHTDPKVVSAAREVLSHASTIYHTLASVLLMEDLITINSLHQALVNRVKVLCKGYPDPARAIVESTLDNLIYTLEVCRKILPKVSFN